MSARGPSETQMVRLGASSRPTILDGVRFVRDRGGEESGGLPRLAAQQGTGPLECVTWNIHRARGADGCVDPARIADVLRDEVVVDRAPDFLALQEADAECPPHTGLLDIDRISGETGLRCLHDSDRLRWGPQSHGFLGTILFLHPEFDVLWSDLIDLPGHCHRGAVVAEVRRGAGPVRVVTTHLSLSQALRMVQMRIIGQYLRRRPPMQTILMGDLNEWRPWGGLAMSPRLTQLRFDGPTRATFPARWPVLPLDRILSDRPGAVTDGVAVTGPGIRAASDHLPLRARVTVG